MHIDYGLKLRKPPPDMTLKESAMNIITHKGTVNQHRTLDWPFNHRVFSSNALHITPQLKSCETYKPMAQTEAFGIGQLAS